MNSAANKSGDAMTILRHSSVRSSYPKPPREVSAVFVRETKTTIVLRVGDAEHSFSKTTRRELGADKYGSHLALA